LPMHQRTLRPWKTRFYVLMKPRFNYLAGMPSLDGRREFDCPLIVLTEHFLFVMAGRSQRRFRRNSAIGFHLNICFFLPLPSRPSDSCFVRVSVHSRVNIDVLLCLISGLQHGEDCECEVRGGGKCRDWTLIPCMPHSNLQVQLGRSLIW
jgi:hypothetical protein